MPSPCLGVEVKTAGAQFMQHRVPSRIRILWIEEPSWSSLRWCCSALRLMGWR